MSNLSSTARALVVGMVVGTAAAAVRTAGAQTPVDSVRCDSIVGAAKVDSAPVGIFVSATRADGPLAARRAKNIAMIVGAAFVPPTPLRLTTFSGPPRMRTLRSRSDTAATLRAPTLTGVYRFMSDGDGKLRSVETLRASLIPGFDAAAEAATRQAAGGGGVFAPPDDDESMVVEIRFSTDSSADAQRIISGVFPRMPVVDAVPRPTNTMPLFPDDAKRDSLTAGEVVLRFVVDRFGQPAMETLEVIRATSVSFVRAAVNALPRQLFDPATIHGCAVAQQIDYPFSFLLPTSFDGTMPSREKPIRH